MKVFKILLFLVCIWISKTSFSQDFSNLSLKDSRFKEIEKNLNLNFPDDHGSHPEYRIEWWYFTSNLKDDEGNDIGLQWTLFRFASEPFDIQNTNWLSKEIWMGHIAVTTENKHYYQEKIARGGISQSGVISEPFSAWIDDWKVYGENWRNLTLEANTEKFNFQIKINSIKPLVLHGEKGFSLKSFDGTASAYYSQPFFNAKGFVEIEGQKKIVNGSAWADREWSSQFLKEDQKGWDWFSINFENGDKLMLFQVRSNKNKNFKSGTYILKNGDVNSLENKEIIFEPVKYTKINKKEIPTTWKIFSKDLELDIEVEALNKNSYLNTIFPYWEGPIKIKGNKNGNGYLEMTGY